MKSNEDVKMISSDAPVIFAKACEIFVLELSLRTWLHAASSRRQTLRRRDVSRAIGNCQTFDFLLDIVPESHEEDEVTGGGNEEKDVEPSQEPDVKPFPVIGPNQVPQNYAEDEVTGQWRGGWQSNGMQSQMLDFNLSNNYFSGEYHGERRRGALPRGSDAVQISLTGANHLRLNSAYNAGEYLVESRREALPRPSEVVEIPLTGTNHLHLNAGEYLGESRRRALPRPSDAVEISLTGGTHLQLNSYNAVPHDEELNELTIYGGNRFGPESSSSSELFFPTLGDNRLNHDYM